MASLGSRALLFERLTDLQPNTKFEKKPFKMYSVKELKQSVLREVEWLLNTRSPIPAYLYRKQDKNAINYGTPDFFSLFHPLTQKNQRDFCELLSAIIEKFEPRLKNVNAVFERYDPIQRSVLMTIESILSIDGVIEQMSFKVLLLNNMRGNAEVWDG